MQIAVILLTPLYPVGAVFGTYYLMRDYWLFENSYKTAPDPATQGCSLVTLVWLEAFVW